MNTIYYIKRSDNMIKNVTGVVISEVPYKENSKILNVLTPEGVIGIVSKGCKSLKSPLRTVSEKLKFCEYTIYYKEDGLSTLKEGTTQLKEGTQGLNSLKEGVLSLQQGSNDLNNGLTTYKASSDKAYDDANSVYSFLVNYLDDYFVQNPDAQNDPQFALVYQIANGYITKDASGLSGLDKLKMSNSGLLSGATNLNNGVNLLASHISSLDGLLDAIDNLDQGASSLKEKGYIDDIIEPSTTRQRIISALELFINKRENRPVKKHGNIPV